MRQNVEGPCECERTPIKTKEKEKKIFENLP